MWRLSVRGSVPRAMDMSSGSFRQGVQAGREHNLVNNKEFRSCRCWTWWLEIYLLLMAFFIYIVAVAHVHSRDGESKRNVMMGLTDDSWHSQLRGTCLGCALTPVLPQCGRRCHKYERSRRRKESCLATYFMLISCISHLEVVMRDRKFLEEFLTFRAHVGDIVQDGVVRTQGASAIDRCILNVAAESLYLGRHKHIPIV